MSVVEAGVNEGYDPAATSPDTAEHSAPSALDPLAYGHPDDQVAGTFYNYFDGATAPASGYVEDSRQDLAFTYTVKNTGKTALDELSLSTSLATVDPTCSIPSVLAPSASFECTGTHVTTLADIQGAETSDGTGRLTDTAAASGNVVGRGGQLVVAEGSAFFSVPAYSLGQVLANGATFPNGFSVSSCSPAAGSWSACVNSVLTAVSENNSPRTSTTPDPFGGSFTGNIAPAAIPIVLDLDGGTLEVNNGIEVPYPHNASGDPPNPFYNQDNTDFGYTVVRHEADPGESDIWIENGRLYDPHPSPSCNPVIDTVLGNNVYLSDVSVLGTHFGGSLSCVGNSGLQTAGTLNLVLTNFTAAHTGGDGVNLESYLCGSGSRDCARTEVTLWDPLTTGSCLFDVPGPCQSGVTPQNANADFSDNARDGLSPIGEDRSTFDDVVVADNDTGAINSEADSANTDGGAMIFNTLYMQGTMELADSSTGPVTINGWVTVSNSSGDYPETALFVCPGESNCVWNAGGVTINHSQLGCAGTENGINTGCILGSDLVEDPSAGGAACGSATPWLPGEGWSQWDLVPGDGTGPCAPSVTVNDTAIDLTKFAGHTELRLATGVWDQFNGDCVIDTRGNPERGSMNDAQNMGVAAKMTGNRFAQITTTDAGPVCAALRDDPPSGESVNRLFRSDAAYGVTWFSGSGSPVSSGVRRAAWRPPPRRP
jgi:hypothetical protein